MLSRNSLRQTVHTHRASVHQAAKLVAALLRVARVTAGLAESNGSLLPGLWLTSRAGWLPRTVISSGTLCFALKYGLPFFTCCKSHSHVRDYISRAALWSEMVPVSVGALHPGLQCWHVSASVFCQPSSTCRPAFFWLNTYCCRTFAVAGPLPPNFFPEFIQDPTSNTDSASSSLGILNDNALYRVAQNKWWHPTSPQTPWKLRDRF